MVQVSFLQQPEGLVTLHFIAYNNYLTDQYLDVYDMETWFELSVVRFRSANQGNYKNSATECKNTFETTCGNSAMTTNYRSLENIANFHYWTFIAPTKVIF